MTNYKSILNNCSFYFVGKFPHKYKDINLYKNVELKQLLTQHGFFEFHTSNKGNLVYYHQVVAFFECGGIHALKRGFTCVKGQHELHHLNSKTHENQASNLVYITEEGHSLITKHQRAFNKYVKRIKKKSLLSYWTGVIWNKQGRQVTNFVDWLFYILSVTICLVSTNLNDAFLNYLSNIALAMSNKKDTTVVNLPLLQ